MTNCIHGCRNLETRCVACGRVVNTAKIDNGWISVKDQEPPKDGSPFLVFTEWGISIMDWKTIGDGFFSYRPVCSCCRGYCSENFKYWMPLPKPPITE